MSTQTVTISGLTQVLADIAQQVTRAAENSVPPYWQYYRIGIPGECMTSSEQEVKELAQGEVDTGYGFDRGDMLLVTPAGDILQPADRSRGTGPVTWVPAEFAALAEAASVGTFDRYDFDGPVWGPQGD
jgi:hypothetical protein